MANNINVANVANIRYRLSFQLYSAEDADDPIFTSSKTILIDSIEETLSPLFDKKAIPSVVIRVELPLYTIKQIYAPETRKSLMLKLTSEKSTYAKNDKNSIVELDIAMMYENEEFIAYLLTPEPKVPTAEELGNATADEEDGSIKSTGLNDPEKILDIEIQLFKKDVINKLKPKKEFIFNEVTPMDAIAGVLTKLELENVIADKPDEPETHPQIIIPAAALKDILFYINNVYPGLYQTELMFICDVTRNYILKAMCNTHACAKDEYRNVDIHLITASMAGGDASGALGSYKDEEKERYTIVTSSKFELTSKDLNTRISLGNKFKVYSKLNGDTALVWKDADGEWEFTPPYTEYDNGLEGHAELDDEVSYFEDTLSNIHGVKRAMNSIKMGTTFVPINLDRIDIEMITFNKTYNIFIEFDKILSEKYNGEYNLVFLARQTSRDTNKYYSTSAYAIFAKL